MTPPAKQARRVPRPFSALLPNPQVGRSITTALRGLILAAVLACAPASGARADERAVGRLECRPVPGTYRTLIVRSSVDVHCAFIMSDRREHYRGTYGIGAGLDLGVSAQAGLSFTVLISDTSAAIGRFALTGRYVGSQASAAAGVGAGAASPLGGTSNAIVLQPAGAAGGVGLGIAAGVAVLELQPDRARQG